jgi:hypothetical protein
MAQMEGETFRNHFRIRETIAQYSEKNIISQSNDNFLTHFHMTFSTRQSNELTKLTHLMEQNLSWEGNSHSTSVTSKFILEQWC